MSIPTYKLILVGDGGTGKTTFLYHFLTGKFEMKYVSTLGVEIHPIDLSTSLGPVRFNVWDVSGQEKLDGMYSRYFANASAALIMFDLGSALTWESIPNWIKMFRAVCPDAPIVVCGNKVDIKGRKITPSIISSRMNTGEFLEGLQYFDISVKSKYNFEKPLLYLAQKLIED